jgi:hypothetical protein
VHGSAAIINQITAGLVSVCQKGGDESNPFGASTVATTTPVDGSPRSFEQVIKDVFLNNNIPWSNFCNPYVIESPSHIIKARYLQNR